MGCAPPVPLGGATEEEGPSITILHPIAGEEYVLGEGCRLDEPLIVDVQGMDLVRPDMEPTEGTGHWHGGRNFESGYCMAWTAYCAPAPLVDPLAEPPPEPEGLDRFTFYDTAGLEPGLLTLFANLHDDSHEELLVDGDSVEIILVDEGGTCGPSA